MTHWQRLPKIELHVHLDAGLSFEAARQLRSALGRTEYDATFIAPEQCNDLPELLAPISHALALLQNERGLRMAADDLVAQLAADRVIYAEVRFAPLLHVQGDLDARSVVTIVADQLRRSATERGIEARLLLCTLRHFTAEQSLETARLAIEHADHGVVGLDLAADEGGFPLDPHVAAFAHARAHGVRCTAHAGEARGADSVRETLARLAPARIGHGVRSIEDPAVVAELRERGVHLEVCPSSNVQIGLFPSLAAHPIDTLRRQGVSVGVNTDGRTITNITLSREYERVATAFGWTAQDFLACNLAALEAAFVADEVKQRLRRQLV